MPCESSDLHGKSTNAQTLRNGTDFSNLSQTLICLLFLLIYFYSSLSLSPHLIPSSLRPEKPFGVRKLPGLPPCVAVLSRRATPRFWCENTRFACIILGHYPTNLWSSRLETGILKDCHRSFCPPVPLEYACSNSSQPSNRFKQRVSRNRFFSMRNRVIQSQTRTSTGAVDFSFVVLDIDTAESS